MAKVISKAEEVTEVTLKLTRQEAMALRALTTRCSPRALGDMFEHTSAIWRALRSAGIDATPIGERFRIVPGVAVTSKETRTAEGLNCVYGDPGCDCKINPDF